MVFWAMLLFIFGIVYLVDSYNPILSGFMKQMSSIIVMMIAMGILYRDLYAQRKTKKQPVEKTEVKKEDPAPKEEPETMPQETTEINLEQSEEEK